MRVPMSRHGAGRPHKRALETLVTKSPERSAGIELPNQGQTPHGTTGVSASQILTVPSPKVPTLIVPVGPTPTVFTVPPAVPPAAYPTPPPIVYAAAYPTPPPAAPTEYPAPPPPVPATTYPAPAPAVPVAPYPVPPPIVPPATPTYIDSAVPPVVSAPAYAAPGVPSSAYPAVPPIALTLVVLPILVSILSHPTDMIATQTQIPALAESVKS
ncbi:leucine-rich repeat extensin-like protein 5 [Zingiber officinale]|uniref:leucine-rich repeat extensin-like protein 5 n=1 Tax=Zingiber officinale TaxID=94328 RepID=UPI001C4B3F28|nr:leucine-rich repeat extensin-like protein 5 [Zingiber officinale]